jgi:hypothetical protein
MKLRVIANAYYVSEDLTGLGVVDEQTFEMSFSKLLNKGDVWEEDADGFFNCISGDWEGNNSNGWWEYEHMKQYFEII